MRSHPIRTLACLAVTALPCAAQFGFGPPQDLLIGPLTQTVSRCELADVNGDGRADLLFSGDSVALALSAPGASFDTPTDLADPALLFSGHTRFADVDADGITDLLARPLAGGLSTRLGAGDGSFGPALPSAVDGASSVFTTVQVLVGDVSGDGAVDVLAANQPVFTVTPDAPTELRLYRGGGDGRFVSHVTIGGEPAPMRFLGEHGLELADVQGDGDLDVIRRLHTDGPDISVLLNGGSLQFREARWTRGAEAIDVFDADGDGFPDLIFENAGGGWFSAGLPSGRFGPAQRAYQTSALAHDALRHADFDEDGVLDLIRNQGMTVEVLRGVGDGRFRSMGSVVFPSPGALSGTPRTAAVDMDGDGLLDVLGINLNTLLGADVLAAALQTD